MMRFSKIVVTGIQKGFIFLLLALYSVGSLQIESFHQLFHGHDDVALHSEEQEQNDCHRLIYHNQSKGDCKHSSHITELKKCPLCQISVQQVHLPESIVHTKIFFPTTVRVVSNQPIQLIATYRLIPARAPPFFS